MRTAAWFQVGLILLFVVFSLSCLEEDCITVFATNSTSEWITISPTHCWSIRVRIAAGKTSNLFVLPGEIAEPKGKPHTSGIPIYFPVNPTPGK